MKFASLCLALIGGASAFAPASPAAKSSALNMADKVECFGAAPFLGKPLFLGEAEWDLFTQAPYGSPETGSFLRAA